MFTVQWEPFTHLNGEVFPEVLPDSPAPDPLGPSAPSARRFPVEVEPHEVQNSKEPEVAQNQDHKESTAKLCCKRKEEKKKKISQLALITTVFKILNSQPSHCYQGCYWKCTQIEVGLFHLVVSLLFQCCFTEAITSKDASPQPVLLTLHSWGNQPKMMLDFLIEQKHELRTNTAVFSPWWGWTLTFGR